MTAGTLSHVVAAVAFLALTALLVASGQRGRHGLLLVLASLLSLVWAVDGIVTTLAAGRSDVASVGLGPLPEAPRGIGLADTSASGGGEVEIGLGTGLTDTLRILAWGLFVHALLALGRRAGVPARDPFAPAPPDATNVPTRPALEGRRFPLLVLGLVLGQLLLPTLASRGFLSPDVLPVVLPSLWIGAALASLVLVEELYRNTIPERRYAIRHLCIALGATFAFDFFVFTDTLLFRRVSLDLWHARGFLYALLVPLIALSVARNGDWALRLHVSRGAVTGSAAVLGAGAYLLATAVAGSLIRYSGVSWAGVAETALIVLAGVGLIVLALSKRLRSEARVLISKHLFSYKYDYRHEWLGFTETLARDPDEAPTSIVKGLKAIVESEAGALWGKGAGGRYELLASRGMAGLERVDPSRWRSLDRFLTRSRWLVDLDERRAHPERYAELELPSEIADNSTSWLIVPLPFRKDVIGFVLIARSPIVKRINWEDRDLLKTAGYQAAGLLAQWRTHEALTEARQFEAFSKLSTYIVHDLKNILGQQSLIVSNAAKHKHKPEFVDDVIATVENSVARMQSLLEQLRAEHGDDKAVPLELAAALGQALESGRSREPAPIAGEMATGLFVLANQDKLVRVFGHLIQNAQEATSAEGRVEASLERDRDGARVRIADDGRGMSEAFVRERLFRPFESTKGLTGMGIGAYESREYVRGLGGEISVESVVGRGTVFTVELPLERAAMVTGDTAADDEALPPVASRCPSPFTDAPHESER